MASSPVLYMALHGKEVTWMLLVTYLVTAVLGCLALVLNAVVLDTIVRKTKMEAADFLVSSLAATDMLTGVLILHTVCYSLVNFQILTECLIRLGAVYFFVLSSLYHLALLTLDRFVKIVSPYRYDDVMSRRRVTAMSSAVWLCSINYGLLPVYGWRNDPPAHTDTPCSLLGLLTIRYTQLGMVTIRYTLLGLLTIRYTQLGMVTIRYTLLGLLTIRYTQLGMVTIRYTLLGLLTIRYTQLGMVTIRYTLLGLLTIRYTLLGLLTIRYTLLGLLTIRYTQLGMVIVFLPFLVMGVFYCKIFLVARRHSRAIMALNVTGNPGPKAALRFTKVVLLLVGTYFLLFAPMATIALIYTLGGFPNMSAAEVGDYIVYSSVLTFSNSVVNPVIYAFKVPPVRKRFRQIFRRGETATSHGQSTGPIQTLVSKVD